MHRMYIESILRSLIFIHRRNSCTGSVGYECNIRVHLFLFWRRNKTNLIPPLDTILNRITLDIDFKLLLWRKQINVNKTRQNKNKCCWYFYVSDNSRFKKCQNIPCGFTAILPIHIIMFGVITLAPEEKVTSEKFRKIS